MFGIAGIDHQVGRAGARIDVEHPAPGLAAVDRLEHPALRVLPPDLAEGRHPGDVRVGGMQHDAVDVLRLLQPQVGPGLAAVERAVDAVADRDAVARVPLARAHPDDVRIGLVDGDGPDRGHRLVVEDRRPGEAAVDRLPDAARGAAGIHDVRIGLDDVERRQAAAHGGRADRARLTGRRAGRGSIVSAARAGAGAERQTQASAERIRDRRMEFPRGRKVKEQAGQPSLRDIAQRRRARQM